MRRQAYIAATATIALSLLFASQSAHAEDKPDKAAVQGNDAASALEDMAHYAYGDLWTAKQNCNVPLYVAARARLLAATAAMRRAAKAAKKLNKMGNLANVKPDDLTTRADDFETLMNVVDGAAWERCPEKAQGEGHSSLPVPGGTKADPPDWAIALAGQKAGPIHNGFDSPGGDSFDGLAMVDRAMRAARGGMRSDDQPCDRESSEGWSNIQSIDRRYPGGFGSQANFFAQIPGFGDWGWQR